LYNNGKNIPVVMSTTQTEADRRAAVVAAIHANAGLTAVDAVDNGNGGVTLTALDGRNVSIWFDSNKVNAGSFGLGEGTESNTPNGVTAVAGGNINTTSAATLYASVALQSEKAIKVEAGTNGVGEVSLGVQQTPAVAQVSQISITSPQDVVTSTLTGTYIEFADMGTATESLSIPNYNGYDGGAGPASASGALSFQSGILYRGDGTNPIAIGSVDSNLNGTLGKPLRINLGYVFSDAANQFFNPANQHFYEVVTPSSPVTWQQAKVLAQSRSLFSLNGYLATVTDASEQSFINGQLAGKEGWIGASDQDVSSGGLGEGNWGWLTGPEAGTLFYQGRFNTGSALASKFANWSWGEPNDSGNEDYAYILGNGQWNDYPGSFTVGSYVVEYGGGGAFGTYAAPTLTNTDLQNIRSRVIYSDSSANSDTASVTINGQTITSAPTLRGGESIATALETAINARINAGTLQNVVVQRYGNTLNLQSTVPGTAFDLSAASTNHSGNTISAQTVTDNKTAGTMTPSTSHTDSHFVNLGFYQGTFGGEVNEATSKMSPPRTGRLAFQIGANEGQRITIDLADFGKGGPITGEITWDADLNPLVPGSTIPEALPGGPNLMGKPLTRTFISSLQGAQDVLKKLDVAMDKVNQTRATMGAVMNRLDHVINNLTNVSMNLSGSRSQIEDADYAAASTELAKTQIMQQASTAILAQANLSQQSVLKLLAD
jgi:flagellin-like hook-associated protein FlgL